LERTPLGVRLDHCKQSTSFLQVITDPAHRLHAVTEVAELSPQIYHDPAGFVARVAGRRLALTVNHRHHIAYELLPASLADG